MSSLSSPTDYGGTRRACYAGYVVQAVVNNLAPVLFVVFQGHYDLPLERLGRLVLLNFAMQLVTGLVAVRYADRWGYRRPLVVAHVISGVGLVAMGVLPAGASRLGIDPYAGLMLAVVLYGVGGGLLEVMVSPVVDALPDEPHAKPGAMSLLHAFYCWGQVLTVVGTTLGLWSVGRTWGVAYWPILPLAWAIVPAVNAAVLARVPMPPPPTRDGARRPVRRLLGTESFVAIMVLMLSGGAAELTLSQWSSMYADVSLGLPKVWGDLAGPATFALFMGIGRTAYGVLGRRLPLLPTLGVCSLLATGCYVVAATATHPAAGLAACALCGLAVSLLWPGAFSLAAARVPTGGTAMFALLAVCGDAGGAAGPWLAGAVGDGFGRTAGEGLRVGLFVAAAFPLTASAAVLALLAARHGGRINSAS